LGLFATLFGFTRYHPPMARQQAVGRRVGILGGTFDPPHVGHLVTATRVAEHLDLDEVLLVVANVPWQKTGTREISPAQDRLDMVRACVADEPRLDACDLEVRRGGDTFTVDTLEELRRRQPDDELVLILGSDAAAGLDTWHRPEDLRSLCRLAVVERPGVAVAVPSGFHHDVVDVPRLEVSSTEMRSRVREGRSVRYLVPDAAISMIMERRLYRVGRDPDRH